MRVAQLWRYPVKSLAGERLPALNLVADGVQGDRAWGLLDHGDGRILTARREPQLLFASARLHADGTPHITLPGGQEIHGPGAAADAALSAWLGKPVSLVAAAESQRGRAEYFADATDDTSQALEWTMPAGRFVDAAPVLMMTTAGLRLGAVAYPGGAWDVRRFRPNVLVELAGEGWLEDTWLGRVLRAGTVQLAPEAKCVRCSMVTRAQPGLAKDTDIYKAVHRTHAGDAGVRTHVVQTGTVSEGDTLEFV